MGKNANQKKGKKDANFEQLLSRLEKVVEAMESDEATLEASIELYKEGVTLSNQCGEILERLESEVMLLQKDGDNIIEQEFEF